MTQPSPGTRGLILFADDERIVREGLGGLLERNGFRCLGAASAEEALELLRVTEFDAMISDIHMPGNIGLELIESVPQVASGLPVILLTGRPTVESAARSVRLSVAAYLTKPPDFGELCQVLDEVIARHRGFRALRAGRARLAQCNEELTQLEAALRSTPHAGAGEPMAGYLNATLRQVMLMLADIAQATTQLGQAGPGQAALDQVDLLAATRRTVDVLERTKRHFKSKDLAELRKHLEQLLDRAAPGTETTPPAPPRAPPPAPPSS